MKFKHFLGISVVILLAFVVVGCAHDSTEKVNEDSETSSDEGNTRIDLGMSFEAEGVKHTLNYVLDNWYNPYDEYHFESADEGWKLVAINVAVENIGSEESNTSNLYYRLHFGALEPVEMSFYGGGTTGVDTNLVRFPAENPLAVEASSTGDLLFEVPAETTVSDWTLEYNSDFLDFVDDNLVVMTPLGQ